MTSDDTTNANICFWMNFLLIYHSVLLQPMCVMMVKNSTNFCCCALCLITVGFRCINFLLWLIKRQKSNDLVLMEVGWDFFFHVKTLDSRSNYSFVSLRDSSSLWPQLCEIRKMLWVLCTLTESQLKSISFSISCSASNLHCKQLPAWSRKLPNVDDYCDKYTKRNKL